MTSVHDIIVWLPRLLPADTLERSIELGRFRPRKVPSSFSGVVSPPIGASFMETHLPSDSIAKTAATEEESTKNDSVPKNAEAGSIKSREDNEKIPFDVREKPSRLGPDFSFYGPPNAVATTTPLVDATLGNVKKGDFVVEMRKPPSSAVAENDCDQVGSSVDKTLGNLEKGEPEGGEHKVDETKESRTSKGKSKRSKRSKDSKSSSPYPPPRPVPTHFVGIRVSEAMHIVDEIRSAQKSVVEQNGNLERAVVPVETMHVTLTVLSLNNDEEVEKAREAMKKCGEALERFDLRANPLVLNFEGLKHFRNEIIFVALRDGDESIRLKEIAVLVRETFVSQGIDVIDADRDFTAHMTVMKLSRMPFKLKRKFGVRRIEPALYDAWASPREFGSTRANGILLLSMAEKDADGFYKCLDRVDFVE